MWNLRQTLRYLRDLASSHPKPLDPISLPIYDVYMMYTLMSKRKTHPSTSQGAQFDPTQAERVITLPPDHNIIIFGQQPNKPL